MAKILHLCLMLWLAQSVGSKLMYHGKRAGGIAISIKTCSLISQQFQRKLEMSTQSAQTVAEECFALFQEKYQWQAPVRAITVRAIYLDEDNIPVQQSFFVDGEKEKKRENLDRAVQDIRRRFGNQAIFHACLKEHQKIPSHSSELQLKNISDPIFAFGNSDSVSTIPAKPYLWFFFDFHRKLL